MTRRKTPVPAIGLPEAAPPPALPEAAPPPAARSVRIDVPVAEPPRSGYRSRRFHVEVQLSHTEAVAFRSVQEALDASHTRLACGRIVQSKADVIRWLLERIAGNAKR